ncbi:MAG TPA: hypothetical protein VL463_24900 [Kofleriaceae bacterium]|nr:hypothetical protein [Kofleriaceae bacterium]
MRKQQSLALALFIAACGSNPPTQPDAPPGANDNAAIVINGKDGPMKDVHVVWVNPDGKVAAETKTGADGRASATIVEGASVTAEVDGLTTVLALVPGEHVTIAPTEDADPGKDKGALAVKLSPEAGATQYTLVASCSQAKGATTSIDLPIHGDCSGAGLLLAIASDANGMLAYALDEGVDLEKGDYTLTGKWKDADHLAASLAGIDAAKEGAITLSLATEVGFVTDAKTIANTAATADASLAGAFGVRNGLALSVADAAGAHSQLLLAPVDKGQTKASFDLSKDLLAWITGVTYDAKTRTATVATTAGDQGTLLAVDLAYGQKAWHVFGPSNGKVTLPTLPASFDALAPAAADTVTAKAALIDVEGDTYKTLQTIAPWAEYNYAGHPQVASTHKVRISK